MDFWHMQLDYPQEADVRVKPYSHPFYLLFSAHITPSKFGICVRWKVLAKYYKICLKLIFFWINILKYY